MLHNEVFYGYMRRIDKHLIGMADAPKRIRNTELRRKNLKKKLVARVKMHEGLYIAHCFSFRLIIPGQCNRNAVTGTVRGDIKVVQVNAVRNIQTFASCAELQCSVGLSVCIPIVKNYTCITDPGRSCCK